MICSTPQIFDRWRGDTSTLIIVIRDPSTGALFDATNHTLISTVKAQASDPDSAARIQKISTVGGITVQAVGRIAIELVPADSEKITPGLLYVGDVQAQHITTGKVSTVAYYTLGLAQDITRDTTISIDTHTTQPPLPSVDSAYVATRVAEEAALRIAGDTALAEGLAQKLDISEATVAPTANKIPRANSAGRLATSWLDLNALWGMKIETGNFTAIVGTAHVATATATVTDPSTRADGSALVNGDTYFVRLAAAVTVTMPGGGAFSTVGKIITRARVAGAWLTTAQNPDADTTIKLAALEAGAIARASAEGTFGEPAAGVTVGAMRPRADGTTGGTNVSLGAVTLTASTEVITFMAPHNLSVGDGVSPGTLTTTTSLTEGNTYYVKTVPSSTEITVATTPGGSTTNINVDGTANNFYRREPAHGPVSGVNPIFRILGTRAVIAGGSYPLYYYAASDPTILTYTPGVLTGPHLTVEFEVAGRSVDILVRNADTKTAIIYLGDRVVYTVTAADFTTAGVTAGNVGRLPLSFATDRLRTLRVVYAGTGMYFPGVDIVAGKFIGRPELGRRGPFVQVVGDSFTEGTGDSSGMGCVEYLRRYMGWNDVWRCGSGSTGYIADGTRSALIDRYTNDIVAQHGAVVIIMMGINDMTAYAANPATFLAAVATIWDATLASSYLRQLIIVGPFPNNGGVGVVADLVNMDRDLRTLAINRGLRYISPIGEGWTFTLSDTTHPDSAGHKVIAQRIAGHLLSYGITQ